VTNKPVGTNVTQNEEYYLNSGCSKQVQY